MGRSKRRQEGHRPRRRTQEERRRETRGKLLEATIECLSEHGYARTSTTEIVKRAGVSRGAQVHHFPTKIDLVTAAVSHLMHVRVEEFRAAFDRMPSDVPPAQAALEILWPILTGPTFDAWLELAVAARTRPDLRKALRDVSERLESNIDEVFGEIFPGLAEPVVLRMASTITFALLEGLALRHMVDPHDPGLAVALASLRANGDAWLGVASAGAAKNTGRDLRHLKEAP